MLHLPQLEAHINHWNTLIEQELAEQHFNNAREAALEAASYFERQAEDHESQMFLATAFEIERMQG